MAFKEFIFMERPKPYPDRESLKYKDLVPANGNLVLPRDPLYVQWAIGYVKLLARMLQDHSLV